MYCRYCGSQMSEFQHSCPNCNRIDSGEYSAPVEPKKTSGMAIAGFIMSIIAFIVEYDTFYYDISLILGIVFSSIGIANTRNHAMRGRKRAIAGLWISILSFVLLVISFM